MKKAIKLDEQKEIEVHILNIINDTCELNNINYSLFAGTAIGAIRHKGFIPWDDDIDICMMRDDYNKLLDALELNENVEVLRHEKDEDYPYPYAKVVDNRTKAKEFGIEEIKNYGVFVGVFPIDNVPNSNLKNYILRFKLRSRMKILRLKQYSLITSNSRLKRVLKRLLRIAFYFVKTNKLVKSIDGLAQKYNKEKCKNCSTLVSNAITGINNSFPNDFFNETIKVEFEKRNFKIVKEYDSFLKAYFGDYMTLPPEEQRISNHGWDYIEWK